MSDISFADLRLPKPHYSLNIGSGTHAEQVGLVMIAYERLCKATNPDWIVAIGDVNSALACALAATKIGVPVAHLEAGLRSFDRRINDPIGFETTLRRLAIVAQKIPVIFRCIQELGKRCSNVV